MGRGFGLLIGLDGKGVSDRVCDESFWVDDGLVDGRCMRSRRCARFDIYVRRKTGRCEILEVAEECMYVHAKCIKLKIHGQWTEGYCEWRV